MNVDVTKRERSANADAQAKFSTFVHDCVNEKGHPFQFALLKHVRTLHASGKSRWIDEVGEWPVVLRDKETHIDLSSIGRYTCLAGRRVQACESSISPLVGYASDTYGLALEAMARDATGNSCVPAREAFEDVLTQVFRSSRRVRLTRPRASGKARRDTHLGDVSRASDRLPRPAVGEGALGFRLQASRNQTESTREQRQDDERVEQARRAEEYR